ncbi:reprolysin-like metallopeptidase [Vibrio maritimus]|uniref:reprolysin-like metallopeptidase n=1 Tax=Vibrio maritimus TaxID=990268 RepID=UPI001F2FBB34|nr:hypothetical protein [Vibrio maritimus]
MKAIFILFIIALLSNSPALSATLKLPECLLEQSLETEVHFYISEDVLNEYSPEFVKAKIDSWIAYANTTLKNSCIPTRRSATHIEYVSELDSSWFQDVDVAERLLKNELGRQVPETNANGHPIFNAIVFSNWLNSYKSQYCGYASSSTFFFTIALNCPDSVLEHEIGHLSGASHDIKTLKEGVEAFDLEEYWMSSYPPGKPYSLGYVCAGRGTIMSYEDDRMPVYSNPNIYWDSKICGDAVTADNSRVLTEFAKQYLVR